MLLDIDLSTPGMDADDLITFDVIPKSNYTKSPSGRFVITTTPARNNCSNETKIEVEVNAITDCINPNRSTTIDEIIEHFITFRDITIDVNGFHTSNINYYMNAFKHMRCENMSDYIRNDLTDPFNKELFKRYYSNDNIESFLRNYITCTGISNTFQYTDVQIPIIVQSIILQRINDTTSHLYTKHCFHITDACMNDMLKRILY